MSVSAFVGLQTTLRGLLAQQRALDVTSHNVANANTEGYSRQEAVLAAAPAHRLAAGQTQSGAGAQLGVGVDVLAYRRIRETFLDLQYRAQNLRKGEWDTRSRSLEQAELALAEPGENGIATQLGRFWSGWAEVANAPESQAARQALVTQAQTLAATFASLDSQLETVGAQAAQDYASLTGAGGAVAQIADEIARLNSAIRSAMTSGATPNDLMDRRDLLLDRLSELGQVSVLDLGGGGIRVSLGDAALPVVDDTVVNWPQALTAPGGKLGALLTLSQPGGTIDSYRNQLDDVARQLADAVNALHNPGGTGSDFFSYTAGSEASTLAVVVTPATLRTSVSAAAGANDIALAIAGLRGGAVDAAYGSLVTRIGTDAREAVRQTANARVLTDAVSDRRDSTSGVSMDEEMANLVRFQRGYQASARAMSAMDEVLDTLINRTGRVGL